MIFFTFLLIIAVGIYLFMQTAPFGKMPEGERLERIQRSPYYQNGKFLNLSYTPDLAEGVSYYTIIKDFFFKKKIRNKPARILPSKKTNILTLAEDEDIFIWFGHSSYYLQVDRKKILVDPVFSGNASPISGTTKSFPGSDIYQPEDFPNLDYLFITHDHWDHLDYKTIAALKPKIGKIVTSLGVGAHLESWGFDPKMIIELEWKESATLEPGFEVTSTPARHFSGRTFKRCPTIWSSFVLKTPNQKIYLGGDSGYDTHFAEIGKEFGPFDWAFLECGQYNEYWKYIHMIPEEVVQAALDLNTRHFIPVHWGKFSLAMHTWDDSIIRVTAESKRLNTHAVTPFIGEAVRLTEPAPTVDWWTGIS